MCNIHPTFLYSSININNPNKHKEQIDTSQLDEKVPYDRSNFEEVKELVESVFIKERQAISMKLLHQIYDIGIYNVH